jgi:hypothetical protein
MSGVVRSGTRVAGFGADAARGVDGLFDPKLFSNKLLKKGSGVDLVDLDLLTDVHRADVLANISKTGKLGEFDDLVKNSDFIALRKLDDVLPPNTVARKAYDDGVKSQVKLNKLATGKPKSVSTVEELGTVTGVPVAKLNKQATMWQKVVNGDTLIQQGLKKLGYTNIAIGGFVIMVLCMMYDTDNPFKALDRALDDAGTSVRAIKEVAGEAAGAAVDLTKGGFNFVSFVTKNSGLSSACSILCLILIVAMVMLSFMSGGKNK